MELNTCRFLCCRNLRFTLIKYRNFISHKKYKSFVQLLTKNRVFEKNYFPSVFFCEIFFFCKMQTLFNYSLWASLLEAYSKSTLSRYYSEFRLIQNDNNHQHNEFTQQYFMFKSNKRKHHRFDIVTSSIRYKPLLCSKRKQNPNQITFFLFRNWDCYG